MFVCLCTGNYSVYGFQINLSRSLGPFILSVYLPSAMFVMMSWVSFFIPPVGELNSVMLQVGGFNPIVLQQGGIIPAIM
jgi:glycerol uptake facilitator-like aquaporin